MGGLIQKDPKTFNNLKILQLEEQMQIKAQYDALKHILLEKRFKRIKAKEAEGQLHPRKCVKTDFK